MPDARPPKENPPTVTAAEWEVMKTLWERGPLAARDIYAALPASHGWAYNTVKTMISRLVAKGAVAYEQIGNSYLYRAALSRENAQGREVRGFIDRVLGGSLLPMLAHYIEEGDLTDADAEGLRQLLANQGKTKKRKKGADHE